MGPHARARGEADKKWPGFRREATRWVCWEFNQAQCHRVHCKYEHLCEACYGTHAKVACNKVTGSQASFRSACPSSSGSGRRDGGGHVSTEPAATSSKRA